MAETTASAWVHPQELHQGCGRAHGGGRAGGLQPRKPTIPGQGWTSRGSPVSSDEIFSGACRGNCGGGCFLNVHVRDGQVVRTTARDMPDPQYNRICTKGLTHVGRVYGANRVLVSHEARGGARLGRFRAHQLGRGARYHRREVEGLRRAVRPDRPSCSSWDPATTPRSAALATALGAYQRFVNVMGCVRHCSLDVDAAVGFGSSRATGGIDLANELTDRKNAKTSHLLGKQPHDLAHAHHALLPGSQGERDATRRHRPRVQRQRPRRPTGGFPIKAGTDGALALGVLNVLLENGWIDDETAARPRPKLRTPHQGGRHVPANERSGRRAAPKGEPDPATGEPTVIDPPAVWDEDRLARPSLFSETNKPCA